MGIIDMKEVAEDKSSQHRQNPEQLQKGSLSENLFFTEIKDILFKILRDRPLNGRLQDTRHQLRCTTMTLLSLFFDYVMWNEQTPVIKEYLQM